VDEAIGKALSDFLSGEGIDGTCWSIGTIAVSTRNDTESYMHLPRLKMCWIPMNVTVQRVGLAEFGVFYKLTLAVGHNIRRKFCRGDVSLST